MNELTLDNKIYVSSKRAAEITGYAKDYVGQLCREGRVDSRLVGRNWYVLKDAIKDRRFELLSGKGSDEREESSPTGQNRAKLPNQEPEPVRYESEKYEVFPAVNRVTETISDNSEQKDIVEGINEAWSSWFSNEKKVEEPPLEEETEEVAAQKVNLRRIREYEAVTTRPDEMFFAESNAQEPNNREERTSPRAKNGRYSVFMSTLFVGVALCAVAVGYIGSAFYQPSVNFPKLLNLIAGAAVYDKVN